MMGLNRKIAVMAAAVVVVGLLQVLGDDAQPTRRLSAVADSRTETATTAGVSVGTFASERDRSPVDLAISEDGNWLVTANQGSDSASLVEAGTGRVQDEVACGRHPVAVVRGVEEDTVLVSCRDSGEIIQFRRSEDRLVREFVIKVGFEPYGLAVAADGRAFVGLTATGEVAEIDLRQQKVLRKIEVGPWPRYLTLSPDGTRLAVGCGGASEIVVVDTEQGEVLYGEPLSGGINPGHMVASADGTYAYFTWMVYRSNPITPDNIRRGWVLASRIGRVRLDGSAYREAISLDVPGLAVADPHGLRLTADGQRLVASASGTQELLVYRLPDLPFVGIGGPGDLIDRRLQADRDRFRRIELQGRPMGIEIGPNDRTVYVANYLRNSVQVVDLNTSRIRDEIRLGGPSKPSLARRGEALFYDGRRSLDQWYSCHTCHYEGGTNSKAMDTWNDGSELTMKTVLPLHHLDSTGPWTWHGWQEDLNDAMHTSFTSTMQGRGVTRGQAKAILTYLKTLESIPSPFREEDGGLTAAAERGRHIFESSRAACSECHSGPMFTDGKIHDVGLGSSDDAYQGYNTPTLIGVRRKVRFLHDGRSKSLEHVLSGPHSPSEVSGAEDFTDAELSDLVAYLKSL